MGLLSETQKPEIIIGNQHKDHRGTLSFINDFDLSHIKRMYTITHESVDVIRAWQGHRIESKYFKCIKGRFLVSIVAIDDWEAPSENLKPELYILDAKKTEVLHVPSGYANGFKALDVDSELLVFSNLDLESAKNDQYRFDQNLWLDWNDMDFSKFVINEKDY
ncbi:dTDP-4-dehydrorhamnose 3,5-epimerase family protein [Oceanihabitans sediminis]|uniref:dTDP-4-dehydrorhamnose 3,5-epimerase family protein n=1 Tax=Oceanihabitans sediminis TaxID=1812012 RepID=UPI003A90DFD2